MFLGTWGSEGVYLHIAIQFSRGPLLSAVAGFRDLGLFTSRLVTVYFPRFLPSKADRVWSLGFCEIGLLSPKGPCTQINSIYFSPKVPVQGLLIRQSIYHLGT